MGTGRPDSTIPNYLKARSLVGLRRLMLRNNARHGCYFPYFDIQFVQGYWYAFFFQSIENALEKGQLEDGE